MTAGAKSAWFEGPSVPLPFKAPWAVLKSALAIAVLFASWGASVMPGRMGDRCLVTFGFLLTTGLGGLFFVLLHHVLGARWSRTSVIHARGVVELVLVAMIFIIPIALRIDQTWPWFVSSYGAENDFARVYKHPAFAIGRLVTCCVLWLLLGLWYTRANSLDAVRRDSDAGLRQLRFYSGPALAVLALTLTCFSFDWVMPLQNGWHSAVLGVYVFAGGVPAALAMLAYTALGIVRVSPSSVPQAEGIRHDVAKLLFGFTVFWAYIAFSQYLLIWYAGIPCEMQFYSVRSGPAWQWLTILLIALHFVVPFLTLLSARAKRSTAALGLAAGSVLIGHWLDWYWLILPALDSSGAQLGIADLSLVALCVLAIGFGVLRGVAHQPHVVSNTIHLVEAE